MNKKIIWYLLVFAFFITSPFLVWVFNPSHPLQVWILDKTVPNKDYREHKGLMWALNHYKIINQETGRNFRYDKDYYGFYPEIEGSYQTKNLPKNEENPNLIYITDTYGVYTDDLMEVNQKGTRSNLIYGGLQDDDVTQIKKNLKNGNTLIAEFNTLASPTSPSTRKKMEEVLRIKWKGWMGRYFRDLTSGIEVPVWLVNNYEKKTGQKWSFTGAGMALVSESDQVVILEKGKDFGNGNISFSFEQPFMDEFNIKESIPYYYWFDYTEAMEGTEILANYHLDITSAGIEKLKSIGLSEKFPAIVRHKGMTYSSYYFAGDFADSNKIPDYWQIWGIDLLKKWFTKDHEGEPDFFFWKGYMPIMKKILKDIESVSFSSSPATMINKVPIYEENGIKQVSKVQDGHITLYDGKSWNPKFWAGINLGATTPGYYPGELSPTKSDYMRWFRQMQEMHISVIRIYTILPPVFYETLAEYNRDKEQPLLFLQGIWSPEEELIGADGKGRNAYTESITTAFQQEIKDAVRAVHGDITIAERPGHASGDYRTDVSPYILGWITGTEWYPYTVKVTNDSNPGKTYYKGTYFASKASASPFESWLASMLDVLAHEEMKYGWQHPVSFTNWLTTDPLKHPNEPLENEDLVSVDPMNITPTKEWSAGYFAAYHVYPYYPDFLRYEQKYQTYRDARGKLNPYAGYLYDLRAHHKDIPLIVAEFGVPSSRGMAHIGPMGKNQGMHTEKEQGKMDADMMRTIYDEFYDGGLLFSWQDEWFKFTWNTLDLELPGNRKAMWRNRLTNEENFGVIAVEPGKSAEELIQLDGKTTDWEKRQNKKEHAYSNFDMSVSHDESYLYLLLKKKQGNWDFSKNEIDLGFDTLSGGSKISDKAPGLQFSTGIEFLLQMKGEKNSRLYVNSAYDQHTWTYASTRNMLPDDPRYKQAELGIFLPWKLALNKGLFLPQTKQTIPFEDIEVGIMKFGKSDPNDPDFNSLVDWYAKDNVLEIRIPWLLLGFTDPSTLQVWKYPYPINKLETVTSDGVRIEPALKIEETATPSTDVPLFYHWEKWDMPTYHERKKQSYDILRHVYGEFNSPKNR